MGANRRIGAAAVPAGASAASANPAPPDLQATTNRLDVKVAGTFTDPAAPGGRYTLPTDWPARAKALAKTVGNLFDKSLHVYTKGAGTENANARILVAHGQDVDEGLLRSRDVDFSTPTADPALKAVEHGTRTIATNHTVKAMRVSAKATAARIGPAG